MNIYRICHYISVQYIQFPNYVVYDIFIKGFIEWIQSKIRVPSNSNFIRIEELERGHDTLQRDKAQHSGVKRWGLIEN